MNKDDVIILLETERAGYTPSQCGHSLTVKQLIQELEEHDEDALVYFSNDNGYTYGRLYSDSIHESTYAEEEDR